MTKAFRDYQNLARGRGVATVSNNIALRSRVAAFLPAISAARVPTHDASLSHQPEI